MILVILPLGKAAPDIANWAARVVMYTAGSVIGGATLAFIMAAIGTGLHALFSTIGLPMAVGVLGVAALLFALHELNILHLPNPQIGWQVPKSWQRSSRMVGNTLYGIVLGMGIFTFIPFASFYMLLALEMAVGAISMQAAVLLGVTYGLFRGFPAVAGGVSMLRDVYPLPVSNWLLEHLGWWHAINALALLLVSGLFLGSLVL